MSVWFSGAGGGTLAAGQVRTVSKASSSVLILGAGGFHIVKGALFRLRFYHNPSSALMCLLIYHG